MATEYRRGLVKVANERLRKLEKVYHATDDSNAYRKIEELSNTVQTTGKFFNVDEVQDSIRFINKTDFMKLTEAQKVEYNDILDKFLEAKTSTFTGVENKFKSALESFNKDNEHGFQFDNVDQYKTFWKTYQDVTEGRITDEQYNELSLDILFNNYDIKKLIENNTLEDVLRSKLGNTGTKWSSILTKKTNIRKNAPVMKRPTVVRPSMAARAPRRPSNNKRRR